MDLDYGKLTQKFQKAPFHACQSLGKIGSYDLLLLTPRKIIDGPNILVAAAFHGDEPASPYGILEYLKTKEIKANVSFLPLVNPTGWVKNTRENAQGEDVNRGFCLCKTNCPHTPTSEGRLLLQNKALLIDLSKNGFLTLHEDWELDRFYFYLFEGKPSDLGQVIHKVLSIYARPKEDGIWEGESIKGGMILGERDYGDKGLSFENFLHQTYGIPAICSEVPGRLEFHDRIQIHRDLCGEFARWAQSHHNSRNVY